MHVIKRRTLKEFWERRVQAEGPLRAWFHEVKKAEWKGPSDIKERYSSADFLPGNRVIFNISGNSYRLVVKIMYQPGLVYIRFVGTHAEYDKIDAETV